MCCPRQWSNFTMGNGNPQACNGKQQFNGKCYFWSLSTDKDKIGGTARNSSLTITRVGVEDLGSYSCVALNR